MILNVCVEKGKMVDENVCKHCKNKNCEHAGELITSERIARDKISKAKTLNEYRYRK
jgi:hypothetical protein